MNLFSFQKYVPSLSDKDIANEIFNSIMELRPIEEAVTIDLSGMVAMTTICARLIFGRLYIELGKNVFSKNINITGVSESIQIVIRWGIYTAIEQSE